jgi:hypothetical protein
VAIGASLDIGAKGPARSGRSLVSRKASGVASVVFDRVVK